MFDKKGFIQYVGDPSGASYGSGLENIERTYGVDIDAEFDADACAALLARIHADTKTLPDPDKSNRQNWQSHLKRYIEYRQNSSETRKWIRFVLDSYQTDFAKVDQGERYKWKAVAWFREHWDLTAPNFADMIKTAFSKASNLLDSGPNSRPYSQICEFADADPASVRTAFTALYNESQPLSDRILDFQSTCNRIRDALIPGKTSYQDLHAISVYLSFAYPETYYIYKFSCYQKFAKRTAFSGTSRQTDLTLMRYENLGQLCQLILDEVNKQPALLALHKERLDSSCYDDPALHLLATDIVFYGSTYMEEYQFSTGNHYWPALSEYDPKLTPEMWDALLQDKAVTSDGALQLFHTILQAGGECSVPRLEACLHGHFDYKTVLQDFSSKVSCAPRPKDLQPFEAYIIPFVGRTVTEDDRQCTSWKLRDELLTALENADLSQVPYYTDNTEAPMDTMNIGLNTILYGPPGTGKTYHTIFYAVAILENKTPEAVEAEGFDAVYPRYKAYVDQHRIAFTTFHQSYSYEDFIEGIKPETAEDDEEAAGEIRYTKKDGIFKHFCKEAALSAFAQSADLGIRENATVWKVSLYGTGDNPIRTECLENGHIRIGWDSYGKEITDETDFSAYGGRSVLNAFLHKMQIGDIVFSCYSATTIDAIGVITGAYTWHEEYGSYRRVRKVNWIAKNIREDILSMNSGVTMTLSSVYRLSRISLADVYRLIEKRQPEQLVPQKKPPYVFIIDEINRGNISKVFGELITLIEPSKRLDKKEAMEAILPYSGNSFGVPDNVYILGTMNTADRSIAAIDTALRRRFQFREMLPKPEVLQGITVENISIEKLLDTLNRRIAVLYDREHTIGHAYFVPLKDTPTMTALADIFENKILPLLQEYFFEDYRNIRLVLGDNQKSDKALEFVQEDKIDYGDLFGRDAELELDTSYTYTINRAAFQNPDAYQYLKD